MPKEIIPPDPIPVGEETVIDEDLYCASFMSYADNSYSDTSKELLIYLESSYDNSDLGGSTRSFIAHNSNIVEVTDSILNENIRGITKHTLDKYVMMTQSDNDVIIFAILY